MSLTDAAWGLLNQTADAYRDSPRAAMWLAEHAARFAEPLRVTLAGPAGSGRSTLLNAIVGAEVTPATDRLTVDWPGQVTLVDGADTWPDADAVLFLVPQPANPELRALKGGHDDPVAAAHPVATIAVLTRADELGAGRPDAVISARQVARRHARGPEFGDLCQDVVAVAGLLAIGGATLTEAEFDTVVGLAALPRAELDQYLLSADRFADAGFAGLLARFGLFGVRTAVGAIRRGAQTPAALAEAMLRASGIDDLRAAVDRHFVAWTPVLKARSALVAVSVVLHSEPRPSTGGLLGELERVVACAHELRELRLLAALHTGRVTLPDDLAREASALLGGHGRAMRARLGGGDVLDALRRWRMIGEDPGLGAVQRRAASVVTRSCEGMALVVSR